jgi:autotransporter-associated beta strand protein
VALTNGILRNGAPLTSQLNPWGGGVGLFTLGGSFGGFDVTNGGDLIINFSIVGNSTLMKTGGGTLTLLTNNTYAADTIISAGTLALIDPAAINNNAAISIHAGAILDTTGLTNENESLTVFTGQTLRGDGEINGGLVASAGSTVAPGTLTSVGTFTVNNNVTLAGNLFLKLNRTNSQTSDQLVSTTGTIAYGGTLTVSNSGPALQVGDTFQLFPSAVAAFAGISLPTTDASGNSYTWNNNIGVNGSITVATVSSVNPLPGRLQFSVSGNTLSLSWPTNSGWLLQVQTNSLATGLGTNWVTVPGSASVTSTNISINPAVGAAFYRLTPP